MIDEEEPYVEMCDCGRPWGDGHGCNYTSAHYWANFGHLENKEEDDDRDS